MEKETITFRDIFKKTLIDEGFGEGTSHAGNFSYTQRVKGKTWSPGESSPPGKSMTGLGDVTKGGAGDDELVNTKAPAILPYPLDMINDFLADAYVHITNAETHLKSAARNNPVVTSPKKDLLKKLTIRSSKIKQAIYNIAKDIERVSLDI